MKVLLLLAVLLCMACGNPLSPRLQAADSTAVNTEWAVSWDVSVPW